MRSGVVGALLGLLAGALWMPKPLLLGIGASILLILGWRHRHGWPGMALLGMALGWLWSGGDAWLRHHRQLPESLAGQDIVVEGQIVGLVETRWSFGRPGARFQFRVSHCRPVAGSGDCSALRTLLVSWYGHPSPLHSGEHWQLSVRLKPPRGLRNPGGFDYERHLYQRGIDATGYVRPWPNAERRRAAAGPSALRGRLAESLRERMQSLPHGAWLRALSTADQRDLDDTDWALLRATGTVHLFVVSGLHIGLVGGLVLAAVRGGVRMLPDRTGIPLSMVAVAIGAAGAYAALAGWGVPAQRAWLMFTIAALLWWSRRPLQPAFSLLVVAVAVLVLQPAAAWSAGFWLSFGAVAVILLAMMGRNPSPRGMAALWRVQWSVSLGLLVPLTLSGAPMAVVALPANLLAVPVVGSLVVPLNLLAVVFMDFCPGAAMWLWRGADALLGGVLIWLRWWAALQGAGWLPAQSSLLSWALALLGTLLWILPRGWPGRLWTPLLLAPLFLVRPTGPAPGEWQATVLDVGQGLAVVVETAHHQLVYDAGPRWDRYDSGERVVLPYLAWRGIRALDLLMVSHGDNDHAGGAPAIRRAFPGARVLSGEPTSGLGPASRCRAGQRWQWDGVEFRVLHPPVSGRLQRGSNARSCVLLIRGGGHRLILTGDIGIREEQEILTALRDDAEGLQALRDAVVIAAHHGSRTSSGAAWVRAVMPREVIFSTGWRHQFGHPHPEVVERYRHVGAGLWNTAEQGAVQIVVREGALYLKSTR